MVKMKMKMGEAPAGPSLKMVEVEYAWQWRCLSADSVFCVFLVCAPSLNVSLVLYSQIHN